LGITSAAAPVPASEIFGITSAAAPVPASEIFGMTSDAAPEPTRVIFGITSAAAPLPASVIFGMTSRGATAAAASAESCGIEKTSVRPAHTARDLNGETYTRYGNVSVEGLLSLNVTGALLCGVYRNLHEISSPETGAPPAARNVRVSVPL